MPEFLECSTKPAADIGGLELSLNQGVASEIWALMENFNWGPEEWDAKRGTG